MTVVYICDYNEIPFKDMIKILYGKYIPYSKYALKMYRAGRCIYLSITGKIYGDSVIMPGAVPISKVMSSISLGRL